MKINPIMAILAMVFGLGGAFAAYGLSGLSADLMTNGSITLVSSILGLAGIWLFNKDYKIAAAQYIVCGLGVLIGTSLFGILGFLFYLIAGVVAFMEKDKVGNIAPINPEYVHNFGNSQTATVQIPQEDNKMLWLVPLASVIIIILVGVIGGLSYENDMNSKAQSIEITNVSSDLKASYGYYSGGIQANLKSQRDIDNVQIKAIWYSDSGAQLDETYDTGTISDITANQTYKLNFPYYQSTDNKPAKAEIQVYESFGSELLYSHNVTFNDA
ncbi:MAG: hypothetical protein BZ137_00130 [Methanosphaera sp. rholeuAM130]|nr:MAG: hypothetical protein BZ137_00130 [Methanosphaera sp. rholeuAM130]